MTGSRFIYRHGSVGPPPRNRLRFNRSNAVRQSNSCRHSSIGRQSKEQQLSTDCEWTECRWTTGCGPRLVIRNKSRCPIALPASVFDQTNCTAQDLLQRVVSETLKCFAGCCFCGDQLYGPKLVTKNESRCSIILCWLLFLIRSIVRPKTCYKKWCPRLSNALLAVVSEEINCTAQNLFQKMNRDAR